MLYASKIKWARVSSEFYFHPVEIPFPFQLECLKKSFTSFTRFIVPSIFISTLEDSLNTILCHKTSNIGVELKTNIKELSTC